MFDNGAWVLIPIIGVVAWAAIVIAWMVAERSRKGGAAQTQSALEANAAANQKVADQLAAIDRRLAAVEKTLTDIG